MALTPDYIFKRGDVGQVIKRQLWQTLIDETPDLVTGKITPTPTGRRLLPLDGR
jgi:hypothetical protein